MTDDGRKGCYYLRVIFRRQWEDDKEIVDETGRTPAQQLCAELQEASDDHGCPAGFWEVENLPHPEGSSAALEFENLRAGLPLYGKPDEHEETKKGLAIVFPETPWQWVRSGFWRIGGGFGCFAQAYREWRHQGAR